MCDARLCYVRGGTVAISHCEVLINKLMKKHAVFSQSHFACRSAMNNFQGDISKT